MLLNYTIESIQEEPIDDVSEDDNSDFSEKLPNVPRELNISDKIEVFWPIPTIYYPELFQSMKLLENMTLISMTVKDEVRRPLQAKQVDLSIISTIHSEALKINHQTFGHE